MGDENWLEKRMVRFACLAGSVRPVSLTWGRGYATPVDARSLGYAIRTAHFLATDRALAERGHARELPIHRHFAGEFLVVPRASVITYHHLVLSDQS